MPARGRQTLSKSRRAPRPGGAADIDPGIGDVVAARMGCTQACIQNCIQLPVRGWTREIRTRVGMGWAAGIHDWPPNCSQTAGCPRTAVGGLSLV